MLEMVFSKWKEDRLAYVKKNILTFYINFEKQDLSYASIQLSFYY